MNDNLEPTAEKFMHLMDRLRRLGPGTAPPKEVNISPSLLTLSLMQPQTLDAAFKPWLKG